MRRREFIAGLGTTTACPFAAHAQATVPVIGFLDNTPATSPIRRCLCGAMLPRCGAESTGLLDS
jgi:hypothetical protein